MNNPNGDSSNGDWYWPAPTRFGAGRIGELAAACGEAGIARPLVVADPILAAHDAVREAVAALPQAGWFTQVRGNPNETTAAEGVAALNAGQHDGVIAIGGGSALDTGKAVALLAQQTASPWAFVFGTVPPDDTAPIPPVVAVPTTAGTGSEYSASAVIVDSEAEAKRSLWHPALLPARVILDPALTCGLPRDLTLWTGMDALIHAIEAYLSPAYHPMADAVALAAMTRLAESLPRVLAAPDDVAVRGDMLVASAMGGAAFDKGLGAVHALSHAVSARYDTHHGLTNAVLLPYVLAFLHDTVPAKLAAIHTALAPALPEAPDLVTAIRAFQSGLGIPETLADIGVSAGDLAAVARGALADANAPTSPRPLSIGNATELLNNAINKT